VQAGADAELEDCHLPADAQCGRISNRKWSASTGTRGGLTDQLREASDAFIRMHNEHATPFRWKKREVRAVSSKIQLSIYAIKHWLGGFYRAAPAARIATDINE
jgi:hypothetical protein